MWVKEENRELILDHLILAVMLAETTNNIGA
jgi:hypothetical protein